MKQNLDKSNCCLSRHWEFNLSLHTRELYLSHMPNPPDTNRIKVVRVFDSGCANVVRSLAICGMC